MKTFVTNAESLIKQSPSHPWGISLTSPSGTSLLKATIGNGGQAEMGPRLLEVLSAIEGRNSVYPLAITWDMMNDFEDEFTVREMGGSVVYVELEIRTYKYFFREGSFAEGLVSASTRVMEQLPRGEEEESSHPEGDATTPFSISETTEGLGGKQDFFIVGRLDADSPSGGVRDGDTIDLRIEFMGSKVAAAIPDDVSSHPVVGGSIPIRFVGIQTPETANHDSSYGDEKNSEYALRFNISSEDAYAVADEATDYVQRILVGDGYVVIDLDTDINGKVQHTYSRLMGVVYKTKIDDLSAIEEGNTGTAVNLNKSLLVEKSTKVSGVPLAILYSHFANNTSFSRFDVAIWEYELGLKKRQPEDTKIGEVTDKLIDTYVNPQPSNAVGTDPIEVRYADTSEYDNRLNWFRPLDDRMEEPGLNLPLLSEHNVRIGDVMLVVPPLSIQYNRTSSSEKTKTLRTRQSAIVRTGNSESTITLQLYFHDLESINGHQWTNPGGINYHMDGLRSLIAQFKKAPFLPIDNPYINEVLDIDDVALIDISVNTVPGFPNSLSATLRLAKFDISPMMPQATGLGSVVNYPMLRWYYQEAMREHASPLRTTLKKIDPETSGEFNFLIADETDLMRRQNAIQKMRYTSTPQEIMEDIQNGDNQFGRLIKDAKAAEKILKQHDLYYKMRAAGRILFEKSQDPSYDPYGESSVLGSRYGIHPTSELNGQDGRDPSYNHVDVFYELYADMGGIDTPAPGNIDSIKVHGNYFAPYESVFFAGPPEGTEAVQQKYQFQKIWGGHDDVDDELRLAYYNNRHQGYFDIVLETGSNQGILDETNAMEGEENRYILPATPWYVEKLKHIVQAGKDAELGAQQTIDEYHELESIAEVTEGNLPLERFEIDGLICTSVSVSYQNHFAGMNMPSIEGPTMQYLGGQDPMVHVSFEADEEAVDDLRVMLEEIDRFAREYKHGITSGFMGIENGIAGLFGITAVIPEHVVVSTVPNFPGRFHVEMTLGGFDKTQRRTETLEGLSPLYSSGAEPGSAAMSDRHYSNGNMTMQDNSVFEYRMRSLEVYADLELPTYDELNAALPKIGADLVEYKNPSRTRFVDPDFYVATEWTMREEFRTQKGKDQRMEFRDMVGVKMYTDSNDVNKPIDGDQENWDLLREVDEKTKRIDPRHQKDGDNEYNADRNAGMSLENLGTSSAEEVDQKREYDTPSDVKTLLEDSEAQRTQPTYNEWVSWGIGLDNFSPRGSSEQITKHLEGVYSEWLVSPNPTQAQVYDYIHKKVDSLWKQHYYDDKGKNPDNTSWYDIAYSKGSVDIFKANYLSITGEDPASLLENADPDGEDSTIATSDWETFVGGKIPQSRLRNLVKATFHYLSRWTQYGGSGYPDTIGHGASLQVGIGRLRLAEEARNKAEARRMLWDWKYNLDYSIGKMFNAYEKAAASSDNVKKAAPWDWMLHAWDDPELSSESVDSDFFRNVYSRFEKSYNNWALRYGTAQSPVEIALLKRGESVTGRQMKLLKGDRETMLEDLEAVGEDVEEYKDAGKYGDAQVKELYEEKMYELFGYHTHSNVNLGNNGRKIADQTFQNIKRSKYPDEWESWKVYQMTMESIQSAKDAFNLVNYQNPEEMYKGMFTDMLDYDMRGRLVRAFPTFQMFIIDEGRWMTDYRLWDNMYGFNAITSIDVHKNRKIIADTAVIKMTNIYSNLTQRPLSTQYKDWEYSFWSNLVFGNPSEELLDARSELLDGMMLQTGARIHLRMGYGSSVEHLPVVFNGTITEMDTDQLMTIVAQGDGMELTNVISGDPDDDNKDWGIVKEPRDTICNLMTSKGNWFKDAINYTSDGKFFRDNPLGIQHFGMPSGDTVPAGTLNWFNKDYGEVAQNIYSSNGSNTHSKWVAGEQGLPFTWEGWTPIWGGGGEMNIKLNFYNKTVWDIISTITMCSPDYVASVVPFELRSTLFFGKPYYAMAYRYDSKYVYEEKSKQWLRNLEAESRKPFMQFHWYGNDTDIVSNKIKANAEIFTNVIATYGGGEQSPIAYADWDIRYDKQRTTVVEAPIMKQAFDFWTSEDQARMYSYSAVKENMKDMYQGTLVVLGDPSLKPHDMCYLGDQINDMTGNFQVKDVTHSFSLETGFISSITPDAVVVNDDQAFMNMAAWYASASAAVLTRFMGIRLAAKAGKMMMGKAMAQKHIKAGTAYATQYTKTSMHRLIKRLPKHDPDVAEYKRGYRAWLAASDSGNTNAAKAAITRMDGVVDKLTSNTKVDEWDKQGLFDKKGSKFKTKRLLSLMKTGTNVLKDGKNAFFLFRAAGTTILGTTPIGWILTIGSIILTETLSEMYQRKKANYQCVLMMPLKHQGRYFEAGINGHKGMVIGDSPGKMDNYLAGAGWTDDPNAKDEDHFDLLIDTFNFLANEDGTTIEDAAYGAGNGIYAARDNIFGGR